MPKVTDKKAFKPDKKLDATKIEKTKVKGKNKIKALTHFFYIAFKNDAVIYHGFAKDNATMTIAEDIEEYDNEKDYQDRLKEVL